MSANRGPSHETPGLEKRLGAHLKYWGILSQV